MRRSSPWRCRSGGRLQTRPRATPPPIPTSSAVTTRARQRIRSSALKRNQTIPTSGYLPLGASLVTPIPPINARPERPAKGASRDSSRDGGARGGDACQHYLRNAAYNSWPRGTDKAVWATDLPRIVRDKRGKWGDNGNAALHGTARVTPGGWEVVVSDMPGR